MITYIPLSEMKKKDLASLVLSFIDSDDDIYLQEYIRRSESGLVENPLHNLLVAFKQASQTTKLAVRDHAIKNILTYNCLEMAKTIPSFYGNAASKSAISAIVNAISILCLFIYKTKSVVSVVDINNEVWSAIILDLKNEDTSFKEGISEKYQVGLRKLALVLNTAHNQFYFTESASIKRSSELLTYDATTLLDSEFNQWLVLFKEYIDEQHLKSTRSHFSAFKVFYEYLLEQDDSTNPYKFLSFRSKYGFGQYLSDNKVQNLKNVAVIIYKFTNWIIDTYMTDADEYSDETTTIGLPILSFNELERITKTNSKNISLGSTESTKRAMPTSWLFMCKEILEKDDFAWPKTLTREYFNYVDAETNKLERVWVPVSTYVYLTMLEIPLRKIQVISSDSGEGDITQYDIRSKSWKENHSVHAKYWVHMAQKVQNRGIITKIHHRGKFSAGFYINTNKTQDRDKGYSETSGYIIPWNNETLLRHLAELREWQEKYNPVSAPMAYRNIPKVIFEVRPSAAVLDLIPDRFYLFRSPLSCDGNQPSCPPSNNQLLRFWWDLMDELEKRLKDLGEDVEIITKRNPSTGQPERSIFTPHGLRVTGLTALSEAGVPIEVLSKIVAGHATILMTLFYIKYDSGHITEVLNEAQKQIESSTQKNMQRWLSNASWEEAKRYTAFNEIDGLEAMHDGSAPYTTWGGSSCGICPFAGTRCHDGGPIIRKNGAVKKSLYGPAPGGPKNCVRCRHFVTGTPWIIPLWLHGNKLLVDAQKKSVEVEEIRLKQKALTTERYEYVKRGMQRSIPVELSNEIKNIDGILDAKTKALDELLMNAHATYNLLEKVKELGRNSAYDEADESDSNLPMIADENSDIKFQETFKFRGLDTLVQASRIYTHIQDNDLEAERNHFIDQIMFRNDLTPISFAPLSPDDKKMAADAAARFLTEKLNDQELQHLAEGSRTLESLGIAKDVMKTHRLVETKTNVTGQRLVASSNDEN